MANRLSKINFKSTKVIVPMVATAAVAIVALLIPSISTAATQVNLGTASNFAVLAGSGITNIGATTIAGTAGGDLGSGPTPTFTGDTTVTTSGTKYTAAAAAVTAAKVDLLNAYNDTAGRTSTATVAADLAGQTLVGGVYTAASSMGLTGALTLDGQNNPDSVFIFQAGSTLTTGSGSVVNLINGAQPCHVFWQVGSSATFGTSTNFVGHVLALTSITATTGANFKGSLLATNGAVTLDTNTITNDVCAAAVVTPTPTASAVVTPTPTASAVVTPVPTATPSPVATTVTGGKLPNTDSPWANVMVFGLAVSLIGGTALLIRRKRS